MRLARTSSGFHHIDLPQTARFQSTAISSCDAVSNATSCDVHLHSLVVDKRVNALAAALVFSLVHLLAELRSKHAYVTEIVRKALASNVDADVKMTTQLSTVLTYRHSVTPKVYAVYVAKQPPVTSAYIGLHVYVWRENTINL